MPTRCATAQQTQLGAGQQMMPAHSALDSLADLACMAQHHSKSYGIGLVCMQTSFASVLEHICIVLEEVLQRFLAPEEHQTARQKYFRFAQC